MQKSNTRSILTFFFVVFALYTHSQNLPSYRRVNWAIAGYPGEVPNYSLIKNILDYGGSANGTSANDAALQNAIESTGGQNAVIYFPAGTFLFKAPVSLRSGLILRGEGAGNTTLQFNVNGSGNLITVAGSSTSEIANIASSVLKGQSSLVLDNAAPFRVNDYLKIYQEDSAIVNDSWAVGSVGQIIHVDSISGQVVYFSNDLRRNYLLMDAPRVRKHTVVSGTGLECLKIKRLDATSQQSSNIYFSNAAGCWVKGVESDSCHFAHVRINSSINIEITNSYFHGAFSYGATGEGYGICCENTSGECLIENNIFRNLRHAMLLQSGANGNVFDYNYSVAPYKSETTPHDLAGDIVLHGNYPHSNLFEGNIVQNIVIDASHGINGPYNTFLRNRAELYGILVSADAGDSSNFIGNEITGVAFGFGNYIIRGNGNFEYGNNTNGSIIPPGSTMAIDKSYVYMGTPPFWNVFSLWPSIGLPNYIGAGTIPARERYILRSNLTYCLSRSPVTYIFAGNGNWNDPGNWLNNVMPPQVLADGSEIIIDPPQGGKCILNIPVAVNPGVKLTVKAGKNFVVNGKLMLGKLSESGFKDLRMIRIRLI